jgi:hypothetical protein
MRLGREVPDRIEPLLAQQLLDQQRTGDVAVHETGYTAADIDASFIKWPAWFQCEAFLDRVMRNSVVDVPVSHLCPL